MTLYIDPGTGSMLFTILIGILGAGFFALRMLLIKLRFAITGGKVEVSLKKLPFVIFSDHKRYWNIFEPICRELSRQGKQVLYLTASEDDPALNCGFPGLKAEHLAGNRMYAKLNMLNADVVLSTTPGLDVYQWKRSREVGHYVHIPHAPNDITLYRMFGIDYYDSILLSGEYQVRDIRALEALRGLPQKELVKVGIPYMDEMAKRLEAAGPAPEHPRTVLLAPSWGPSAIFAVYGGEIIEQLLDTGYHIIIRPHPQSFTSEKELITRLMERYPESDRLEWNADRDNFEVLRRSDILISDFSGVTFEFALIYNKPIIYTDPNFDLSPYDAWWLDKSLWTVSALPRLGSQLNGESKRDLKTLIDTCIEDPRFAQGRQQVKEETWENPGMGAQLTVRYLLEKQEELAKGGV